MSKGIGEYISERLRLLKEWKSLVDRVVVIARELVPDAEVYVFGSCVTGRFTGSSDIDVLVVVPDSYHERDVHVYLVVKLEEALGNLSHILDIHVTRRGNANKPPYNWWLRKSIKVR